MIRGSRLLKNGHRNTIDNWRELEHSGKTRENSAITTKKLRKMKELENEIRCHSARSPSRAHGDRSETSRTRSVSPGPYIPPVDVKLPLEKFYKLYSKIVVQLETVKNLTETKSNETENLIDLRRQLQRADEFSIRFSRNNLYETKRIINEIKQIIVPYPFEGLSPGDCKVLCKKLILAYQAASQSLQTYINYAKNPSNLEVPDKINELVLLIADMFLCCEHLSLPADEVYIQNDAVKVCNELMSLLNSKVPVFEYVELKEADLTKKKINTAEANETRKLSMYKKKLIPKLKVEPPKKKSGVHSLLATKTRKMKKSEEKKARITHDIYTQKMNPRKKEFGSKNVKFEPENHQKEGATEKKLILRRPKYVTPREVRSQDDDVETMIQTIGDDDISTCRLGSTPREIDEMSIISSAVEKNSLKELLLEAIEELQRPDAKEQKATLKKLLNSIKNCSKRSKSETQLPNPERVKVFHFVSQELVEEKQEEGPEEVDAVDQGTSEEKNNGGLEGLPEGSGEEKRGGIFRSLGEIEGEKDGRVDVGGRERMKLRVSDEVVSRACKYRKSFAEYRKDNIMYRKTLANKPWELVEKISDRIILEVIKEISADLENDAVLRRLYLNELVVLS